MIICDSNNNEKELEWNINSKWRTCNINQLKPVVYDKLFNCLQQFTVQQNW